jgi:hypothetical protein
MFRLPLRVVPFLFLGVVTLALCSCPSPGASQPGTYTLTVSSAAYGTTVPAGAQTVQPGAATAISATASPLHYFVNWTVTMGLASIANANTGSTTVTLNSGDATVQANFY